MKLVEIKDVRVGQIWDNGNNFLIITGFSEYEPEMVHSVTYVPENKPITLKNGKKVTGLMYSSTSKNSLEGSKLIGKLGITHRIEDGKLVEIPHATEFEVDDIVRHENGKTGVIVKINNVGFAIGYEYSINCGSEGFNDTFEYLTKIGILGVTHEFVNDREA
jgi:hypothetical protein